MTVTPTVTPKAPYDSGDMLAALCVWREARGESIAAKLGVVWVLRNRCEMAPAQGFKRDMAGNILKPWAFSSFNADDPNSLKFCRARISVHGRRVQHDRRATWFPAASSHNKRNARRTSFAVPPVIYYPDASWMIRRNRQGSRGGWCCTFASIQFLAESQERRRLGVPLRFAVLRHVSAQNGCFVRYKHR